MWIGTCLRSDYDRGKQLLVQVVIGDFLVKDQSAF